MESIKKYAYQERFSTKSESKRKSPVRYSKYSSEKISMPEMQFIYNGEVTHRQNIHDKITLNDVRAFIKTSYFEHVFRDISDFRGEGYPKYFYKNKYSIVYFGDSKSKNGLELIKWVMQVHKDKMFEHFHYYFTEKPFFGLEQNQVGMFKASDKKFTKVEVTEAFSSTHFESWIFSNQFESAIYMNKHHKKRFDKIKRDTTVLYVDNMSDAKSVDAIKTFKVASKMYQESS